MENSEGDVAMKFRDETLLGFSALSDVSLLSPHPSTLSF